MDPKSLSKPAACVDEALHFFVASNTSWETASNYFVGSKSPRSTHRNEISDPGVRLHSVQPLPNSLTSLCSNVQYKSFMGLFPEINRAWLTVDSNLFLWAYSPFGSPSSASYDFYVYEGFSQVIVSVALITPKPGVFVESVPYLIAIATPVEVTLLGVTFSSTGQLSLIPTHITIPTDNVLMLKILSAPDGRIFMAGADGHLHEFIYANRGHSALFDLISPRPMKRARKVAHSSSSLAAYLIPASIKSWISSQSELVDLAVQGNALFTLSQTAILSVYDISNDRVQFIATSNIVSDAKHHFSFSIPPSEREFVSIHPVHAHASSSVQLIIVTSLAERLYYTTQSPGNTPFRSTDRPLALLCTGFRPGPQLDMSQSLPRPCVHLAWSHGGATVFSDLKDNQSDNLICVFPEANATPLSSTRSDAPQHSSHSSEIVLSISLDSFDEDADHFGPITNQQSHFGNDSTSSRVPNRTFAIAAVDEQSVRRYYRSSVIQPPIFFWVLSSTAVHLFERVSPLDELQDLLASSRDGTNHVQSFFDRYGAADACAMCLEIAVSNPSLTFAAAHAYYAYGLTSGLNQGLKFSQSWSRRRNGGDTDDGIQSAEGGGFDVGRAALRSSAFSRCSGAHDGLVVFLTGALQQIWNCFLTTGKDATQILDLFTSKENLGKVREELLKIITFLERFPPEAPPTGNDVSEGQGTGSGLTTRSNGELGVIDGSTSAREKSDRFGENQGDLRVSSDTRQREHSSINAMKSLAVRTCEALALLLIVSDHQLHRLAAAMPVEYRQKLINTRFCGLVAYADGAVVASSLIESIFSSYPDGGAAMASVGRVLQERCPSYFGEHDVDLHRGLALVHQAARDIPAHADENQNGFINSDSEVGNNFWSQALHKAEEGVSILKTVPDRIFDVEAVFKDLKTLECLPLLVDLGLCIGARAEESGQSERAQGVYSGVIASLTPLFSGEVDNARDGMRNASVHAAFGSKSESFLTQLYEFLQKSRAGEEALMSHRSESVEKYLINKGCWTVLWKYYARHEQYYKAGSVLLKLAESEECSLSERMEFLSNALLNAKSASSKGMDRAAELLAEVGDFLDVARVQLRIREGIARLLNEGASTGNTRSEGSGDQDNVQEALKSLDEKLLDLSTLFNQYARRFNLLEGCLECLRCGSYRDDVYVRQVWAEILERELDSSDGSATVLRDRLVEVGREFYPSDVAFPTVFVLDVFQKYVYEHSECVGTDWAIDVLERIGVSVCEIVDGYRGLIESGVGHSGNGLAGRDRQEVRWSDDKAQVHLIEATAVAIMRWLEKEKSELTAVGRMNGLECEGVMRVVQAAKSRLRGIGRGNCTEVWQKIEQLERRVGESQM